LCISYIYISKSKKINLVGHFRGDPDLTWNSLDRKRYIKERLEEHAEKRKIREISRETKAREGGKIVFLGKTVDFDKKSDKNEKSDTKSVSLKDRNFTIFGNTTEKTLKKCL